MTTTSRQIDAVLSFWRAAGPDKWFARDAELDRAFRDGFLDLPMAAAARGHDHWMGSPEGALALLLLLDQFPRNVFRGTGHMYATDPLARAFARQALDAGHPAAVEPDLQVFFFLPFSHSEDMHDQDLAVELNRRLDEKSLAFAEGHRDIIRQFDRFPHRNLVLGRETTPEEAKFMQEGGFTG